MARLIVGTLFVMVVCGAAGARAETVLFLVAEVPGYEYHDDSYVVPLTDSDDVEHARALIADPYSGSGIVVAEIAAGDDGINRDYRAPGNPVWSWHCTQFLGFADCTIEILDGWPTGVESDVDGWIDNTGGAIGFWSYTIVAELGAPPVRVPGDANGDGRVDDTDAARLARYWGESGASWGMGDFSGNGIVEAADASILAANWGHGTSQPSGDVELAVPEPLAGVLLAGLAVVALARGKEW